MDLEFNQLMLLSTQPVVCCGDDEDCVYSIDLIEAKQSLDVLVYEI